MAIAYPTIAVGATTLVSGIERPAPSDTPTWYLMGDIRAPVEFAPQVSPTYRAVVRQVFDRGNRLQRVTFAAVALYATLPVASRAEHYWPTTVPTTGALVITYASGVTATWALTALERIAPTRNGLTLTMDYSYIVGGIAVS